MRQCEEKIPLKINVITPHVCTNDMVSLFHIAWDRSPDFKKQYWDTHVSLHIYIQGEEIE